MNSLTIQNLSGKSAGEVTTLVEGFITKAQDRIREDVEYPIRVRGELHLMDGQNNRFDLGPEDDPYASEADYDPMDGLVEVYSVKSGGYKVMKPNPEDCDSWTEFTSAIIDSSWTGSNATITSESTIKVAGLYSVKSVFSGGGSISYPLTRDLDLLIYPYYYIFFWIRTSDNSKSLKIRLYTKDDTYMEDDITLRQSNVGQYYWIRMSAMDNPNSINWGDNVTRLQYVEFISGDACTIYVDNMCFAREWAFTAPAGLLQIARADNVLGEGPPSESYPYVVDYGYDPFMSAVPGTIAEACEWLTGIYIIDYLRGIRYNKTSFDVFGSTLELDTDASREGLMGVRTKMLSNYWECLRNWGLGSYGWV
jgi:hypothetical protein